MFELPYIAQKSRSQGPGMWLPFIIIGVLFYVLLLRPQQRQRKEQQAMLGRIRTGDKVITVGGIYGLVTNVKNGILVLKIAEGVKIEVTRDAIRTVITGREGSQAGESQGVSGSPPGR
ncbi:preprotein translocase subunit YajC [bacterium]|nr:preprotein translocase subunit YajC [bacterium]